MDRETSPGASTARAPGHPSHIRGYGIRRVCTSETNKVVLTPSPAALIRSRSGSRDDSRPELSVCVAGLRRIQLRDALTQHGEEAIDFVRRPRPVKQVSAVSGQRSRGASLNYMGLTAPVTNAATSLRCRCVYCSVDRERDIDVSLGRIRGRADLVRTGHEIAGLAQRKVRRMEVKPYDQAKTAVPGR